MRLLADAHVHVYPFYNARIALDSLRRNLADADGQAVPMAFLAERFDCHFFADLVRGASRLLGPSVSVESSGEALLLREQGFPDLYIFAGRQLITRERIEILALTIDTPIPDGLPAEETVRRILEKGGVPVLSWAPGKWFFARGERVEALLNRFRPGTLLVGDTSLRPRGWLMPSLMKRALAMGFGLVAGSDPLPFPGEEKVLGRYGMEADAPFDATDPSGSIRSLLLAPGFRPRLIGHRGWPPATLLRLIRNARTRKEARLAAMS